MGVRVRAGFYVVAIAAALAVWVPRFLPAVDQWREARRLESAAAILYTTDTRGFLESCG